MMGKNTLCDFNTRLKCPLKNGDCPLRDSDFIRDLELFLYSGRTPGSSFPDSSKNGSFGRDLFFSDFFLARRALVFGHDFVEEYAALDLKGEIAMTKRKCRQWVNVRTRWRKNYCAA